MSPREGMEDRKTQIVDQERIFVGAVRRAAILHHPQASGRYLIVHALIQQDYTVRDVFLDALTRERAAPASAVINAVTPLSLSQRMAAQL